MLLDRVLAGECTPAERLELDGLLAVDPALSDHVDALRRGMRPPPAGVLGLDRPARAAHLLAALGVPADTAAASPVAHPDHPQRTRLSHPWPRGMGSVVRRWRWPAVAAALVAALVAGFGLGVIRGSLPGRTPSRVYATRAGQRATITLPDGSRLVLAPASRLTLATTYGTHAREVTLDGAALFTVTHNATLPFRVRTSRAVVEDLGTRFGVHAYGDDSLARVIVAEGAVTVATASRLGRALDLHAGDLALIGPDGRARLARDAAVSDELAWADGSLVFRSSTMTQVAREIARAFDVDVQVSDTALARQRVTAAFGKDADSLGAVLSYLALMLDARVERAGRAITFVPARR